MGERSATPIRFSNHPRRMSYSTEYARERLIGQSNPNRQLLGNKKSDVPIVTSGRGASVSLNTGASNNTMLFGHNDELRNFLMNNNSANLNRVVFNIEDVFELFNLERSLEDHEIDAITNNLDGRLIGFRSNSIEQIHRNLINMIENNTLNNEKMRILRDGIQKTIADFERGGVKEKTIYRDLISDGLHELDAAAAVAAFKFFRENKDRSAEYLSLKEIFDLLIEKVGRRGTCSRAGCSVMGGAKKRMGKTRRRQRRGKTGQRRGKTGRTRRGSRSRR